MRVCIATGRENLDQLLLEGKHGVSAHVHNDIQQIDRELHLYDLLVISLDLHEDVADVIQQATIPVILLVHGYDATSMQFGPHINIIDIEGLWEEQIAERVLEIINSDEIVRLSISKIRPNSNSKLIAVYSPSPREGKTMIMANLLVHMASVAKDKRIIGACLNFRQSDLLLYSGFQNQIESHQVMYGQTLESMLPALASTVLHPEILSSKVYLHPKYKNLHYLPKLHNRFYAHHIDGTHIEHIFRSLTETYDYVVVEVNSYLDNDATLMSLINAQQVIVVCGYDIASVEAWNSWLSPSLMSELSLDKDKFHLIVNEREPCTYLNAEKLAKMMGIDLIGTIPSLGKHSKDTLIENKLLLDLLETKDIKHFKDTIQKTTKLITGLEINEQKSKYSMVNKWFKF